MKTVIGFGYAARSGKDTAARTIIEERGDLYDIRRYAFGDALKREVNREAEKHGGMWALYQWIIRNFPNARIAYDHEPDMTDPLCPLGKQRSLLQWWGTEYRRAQDHFYWVRQLSTQLMAEDPQFALITDVRFDNELAFVKAIGGHTVKVTRHGVQATDLLMRQHRSETELANAAFDYEIETPYDGLQELKHDAVAIFDMIVEEINDASKPLELVDA